MASKYHHKQLYSRCTCDLVPVRVTSAYKDPCFDHFLVHKNHIGFVSDEKRMRASQLRVKIVEFK